MKEIKLETSKNYYYVDWLYIEDVYILDINKDRIIIKVDWESERIALWYDIERIFLIYNEAKEYIIDRLEKDIIKVKNYDRI